MIHRAILHVAGPLGVGKSAFVERFLERELALAICVRAEQDTELHEEEETALRVVKDIHARTKSLSTFPERGYRYSGVDRDVRILLWGHDRIAYLVREFGDVDVLGIFQVR